LASGCSGYDLFHAAGRPEVQPQVPPAKRQIPQPGDDYSIDIRVNGVVKLNVNLEELAPHEHPPKE
jgi:hypothetical protein